MSQHGYEYDAVGLRRQGTEKVGVFTRGAGGAEGFAYDALDNRTQRTGPGIDERYRFDAANQLTEIRDGMAEEALIGALRYDAAGWG